jgi:hypothetical protein
MIPRADLQIFTRRQIGAIFFEIIERRGEHGFGAGTSGRYLIFTAQKRDWHGGRVWQLTNAPNSRNEGVLIPIVAPKGNRVAWAARQPDRTYKIMVADFFGSPRPHLANIRSYEPGGPGYYETGSISSNSRSLFYTSDQDTHSFWQSQIYRLDLATGNSTRLTQGRSYNEHPAAVSTPSGDWVVFMSTQGERRRPLQLRLGTGWWAMRSDGNGLKRLTTMNLARPGDPENIGRTLVAGEVAAGPDGEVLLGDVQDSLVRQTGFVERIQLTCPRAPPSNGPRPRRPARPLQLVRFSATSSANLLYSQPQRTDLTPPTKPPRA